MQISISSRHGQLASGDQDYIQKKLPKLNHIFERLTAIQVTVDFQMTEPEIELLVSAEHKHDFVARERHANVMAAFDEAMAKMEGQLRKYKEKVTHRKGGRSAGDGDEASASE